MTESACNVGIAECGDSSMKDPDIANPAAWLILNSISYLHNVGSLAFISQPFIASIVRYITANMPTVLPKPVFSTVERGNLHLSHAG